MIAVGKKGKKENLPNELQDKEIVSDRKSINDIIREGKF